jgi:predicted acyl esterase
VPAHAHVHEVPTSDGVRLATDVYLPTSATQSLATVLVRAPYDKCGRYTFLPAIAERFNAHGFAVVLQDVRGKFRSEGEREVFVHEASDGAATLDWICDQPWSNGSVGMFGDSYYGFTQWAAASTGHPALKAIVPRVTGTNLFANCRTDTVPLLPLYEWVVHTWSHPYLSEEPFGILTPTPHYYVPDEQAHVWGVLRDLVERASDGSLDRDLYPDGNPAERLVIPALHVGGWFDNLLDHTLTDWLRATGSPAAPHQYLRVNSVDHEDFTWHEFGTPYDDQELDDDALVRYLDRSLAEPIAFLDHYLHDRGGRWTAPTVALEVTNSTPRVADRWPPSGSSPVDLLLADLPAATGEGGRLLGLDRTAPAAEAGVSEWTHDPQRPVPWLSESQWGQCADLPDESPLHLRDDVLTFDTAPVGRPVDLIGPVSFTGVLAAESARSHLVVRLLDLYPDGRARLIAEGAAVAETGGSTASVTVDLRATAYRVRSGHALRLALSSSLFPLYAVHPGHDGDVWDPSTTTQTRQRLVSSPDAPCRLTVTVHRV